MANGDEMLTNQTALVKWYLMARIAEAKAKGQLPDGESLLEAVDHDIITALYASPIVEDDAAG